jgi:hypothetical protein
MTKLEKLEEICEDIFFNCYESDQYYNFLKCRFCGARQDLPHNPGCTVLKYAEIREDDGYRYFLISYIAAPMAGCATYGSIGYRTQGFPSMSTVKNGLPENLRDSYSVTNVYEFASYDDYVGYFELNKITGTIGD